MLAFRMLVQSAFETLRKLLIDKTVLGATTVVGSAYDTSGTGGRKLVRLSNGWLVSVAWVSQNYYFYVSKDKGATWSQLCWITSTGFTVNQSAMVAVGTNVHFICSVSGNDFLGHNIDVLTQTNINRQSLNVEVESLLLTATGACSITSAPNGDLHACWVSKHSTYPNSFNLRYSKSTNGGVSWATPTQLTTDNVSTTNSTEPSIILSKNDTPIIFCNKYSTGNYTITRHRFFSASWSSLVIHSFASGGQYDPNATVLPNGDIMCAEYGADATDYSVENIRVGISTDDGATFSAFTKLTTGNTYRNLKPVITSNSLGEVFVLWYATHASSTTYTQIRSIKRSTSGTWGTISDLTTGAVNQAYPSVCDNYKDFISPLAIWVNGSTDIKYLGSYNEDPAINQQTNAVVVASAYYTGGNGGRTLVRLSNGWLVSVATKTVANYEIYFYLSKDNGSTWVQQAFIGGATGQSRAITSYGTRVYLLVTVGATAYSLSFDALTTPIGTTLAWGTNVDVTQTAMGACSITSAPNGDLHACWVSKNATYPNTFNIRYSKSTNGGVSWSAPAQVTAIASSYDYASVSIVLVSNSPVILAENAGNGSVDKAIYAIRHNGTAWVSAVVYNGVSYGQYRPTATVDSVGVIHVSWDGYDATDPSKLNIRYASSADGGVTWSTMSKLTSGNVSTQGNTAIEVDASNNVWVLWHGAITGDTVIAIRGIKRTGTTWGAIQNIVSSTASFQAPRICAGFNAFEEPLFVYMEIEGASVRFRGKWNGEYTRFDRSRGVVVDSAYDISGNGGRKIVRLSNGWLVSAVANGTTDYRFYGSKDNGTTWSLVKTVAAGGYQAGFAIASVGTNVKFIRCGLTQVSTVLFDANAVAWDGGSLSYEASAVDTGQTILSACSITVSTNGDLHACWASKNSTRPNSFNIRYSKSVDGGVSWSTPTQLTTYNNTDYAMISPSIVARTNGVSILMSFTSTTNKQIIVMNFTTVWSSEIVVYGGATYSQSNPCATVDSNGVIHVVWQGTDATYSLANIRYSKSVDNGATWSAPVWLSTETVTYNRTFPSITTDSNNDVHVMFHGGTANPSAITQLFYRVCTSGVWGITVQRTSSSTNQYYAQLCDNHKDFVEPICIWRDDLPAIKVRGKWYEEVA